MAVAWPDTTDAVELFFQSDITFFEFHSPMWKILVFESCSPNRLSQSAAQSALL